EGGHRAPGRRRVTVDQAGDHVHAAGAGTVGQGATQRGGLHLLGRALAVVARHGAVHDAAAGELRRTHRALPGAAGALLAVRLAAAPADLAARLRGVRALPGRRQLCHDDLVDQRHVGLDVEHLGRKLGRAGLLAGGVEHVDGLRHRRHAPFTGVDCTAERTTTRPPRDPGTAPLMSSRPRSASTACTVRLRVAWRRWPIRPAMRWPRNTRPGVEAPPIEPGLRWLRCWPWEAPTPANPCRFMTPAKPLPLVVPM